MAFRIYPTNGIVSYNFPFATKVIPIDLFDDYAAKCTEERICQLGCVTGVYKKKLPKNLQNMTDAHVQISIFEAIIPPIKFALICKSNNTKRKHEIHARLKIIHDIIQPYRNRVYDAIVDTSHHGFMQYPVRRLHSVECARGSVILYKGRRTQIKDRFRTYEEVYEFVAGVHKYCALLGCIQALEERALKMFERRVLSIIKEFM